MSSPLYVILSTMLLSLFAENSEYDVAKQQDVHDKFHDSLLTGPDVEMTDTERQTDTHWH